MKNPWLEKAERKKEHAKWVKLLLNNIPKVKKPWPKL